MDLEAGEREENERDLETWCSGCDKCLTRVLAPWTPVDTMWNSLFFMNERCVI